MQILAASLESLAERFLHSGYLSAGKWEPARKAAREIVEEGPQVVRNVHRVITETGPSAVWVLAAALALVLLLPAVVALIHRAEETLRRQAGIGRFPPRLRGPP